MEYRNPIYNKNGSIGLEINHPYHGWIPFTARKDDVELVGRKLYERAKFEAIKPKD